MGFGYKCFITDTQEYGLVDDSVVLRFTGDLESVVEERKRLGWGRIIQIEVSNKGIKFIGEVK